MVRALLLALALAAPVTGGAPKKNRHILFVVGDDNGYSASPAAAALRFFRSASRAGAAHLPLLR